jgi:glycosyltransferase involved in cell wall biosynthesis
MNLAGIARKIRSIAASEGLLCLLLRGVLVGLRACYGRLYTILANRLLRRGGYPTVPRLLFDEIPLARRGSHQRSLLVIDDDLPFYDHDAGSLRMMHLLRILRSLDCHVTFLPQRGLPIEPYSSELQRLGVEVIYRSVRQPTLEEQLRERLGSIEVAWICRPHLFGRYYPIVHGNARIKIVYDTIDLHFRRLRRQQQLAGCGAASDGTWRTYRHLEIAYSQLADATVTVSGLEKDILSRWGARSVWVIPTIHTPVTSVSPFEQREGLLFLGTYRHPPNVDAVRWLCREIMPLIWATDQDIRLTILGHQPSPEVLRLASNRITVAGYVEQLEPYFQRFRLFVAPLRFGAGINGKIGQALAYGLPTVTTPIGAEGLELTDGANVVIATDAPDFAAAVHRLYPDPQLWQQLSQNGLRHMERHRPEAIQPVLANLLDSLMRGGADRHA